LIDYLYQELDAELASSLEGHLERCGQCSEELAAMQQTCAAIRKLPLLDPPSHLAQDLVKAASDRLRGERPSLLARLVESMRFLVVHPAMTAAVTLLVVVGISFYAYRQSSPPSTRPIPDNALPEVIHRAEGVPLRDEERAAEVQPQVELGHAQEKGALDDFEKKQDPTASISSGGARADRPARATRVNAEKWAQVKVPLANQAANIPRGEAEAQAPSDNRRHVGTRGLWKAGSGGARSTYASDQARVGRALAADQSPPKRPKRKRVVARRPRPRSAAAPAPVMAAKEAPQELVLDRAADKVEKDDDSGAQKLWTLANAAVAARRCELALSYYDRALRLRSDLAKEVGAAIRPCIEEIAHGGETALFKAQKRYPALANYLGTELARLRAREAASRKARAKPVKPAKKATKAKKRPPSDKATSAY